MNGTNLPIKAGNRAQSRSKGTRNFPSQATRSNVTEDDDSKHLQNAYNVPGSVLRT